MPEWPGKDHRRIGRVLPPSAAPLSVGDIIHGLQGAWRGPGALERFASEVAEYFKAEHVFLVSSGKSALLLILQALARLYPERNEVLLPAFTCYSVPSAVSRAGLRVRLCDVDPETLDFDFRQVRDIVQTGHRQLLCVLPTHLFGFPADLNSLREAMAGRPIPIVEDAAQAMGGKAPSGEPLGTAGDVGFFSLGRGKAISTVHGGIIVTSRADIAQELSSLTAGLSRPGAAGGLGLFLQALALLVLLRPSLFWLPKLLPFLRLGETIYDPDFPSQAMTPLQAGLARGWQKRLERFTRIRQEKAGYWAAMPCLGIGSSYHNREPRSSCLRFPLRVRNRLVRERLLSESNRRGLGIMPAYPESVDRIEPLQGQFGQISFPKAAALSRELVTLPVHAFVSSRDQEKTTALFKELAGMPTEKIWCTAD